MRNDTIKYLKEISLGLQGAKDAEFVADLVSCAIEALIDDEELTRRGIPDEAENAE